MVHALRVVVALALMGWVSAGMAAEPSPSLEERLHEAAREGDLVAVEALLAAGVEVDAATEYGATALLFAASKGHLEAVLRLLEAGASPDVRDRFYDASPLTWAGYDGHTEVVAALLEQGADAEEALVLGVGTGNAEIVRAALSHGPLQQRVVAEALRDSREGGKEEIAKLLEATETRPDDPPPPLTSERKGAYAGVYEARSGDGRIVVAAGEGGLSLSRGEEQRRLAGVGEDRFRAEGDPEWAVSFFGRAGTIEGVVMTVEEKRTAYFAVRKEAATDAAASGEPPVIGAAIPAEPGRWPAFRGRNATGIAAGPAPPATWDIESGENVLWVAEVPGRGHASPIVWDGRIFLATAVAAGEQELRTGLSGDVGTVTDEVVNTWKVLALDAATGEVLWERDAGSEVPRFSRHWKATQANSTPATDGRRVVAVFPGIGMVCYDLEGRRQWGADPGELDSGWFYDPSYQWGFGSSPVFFQGLVFLQVDVTGNSYLGAWESATGRQVWRAPREDAVPGWSTPVVVGQGDRSELVANGRTIRAYDPRTGEELWRLGPNSELPIATPVAAPGAVFVSAGYPPVRPIYAVRPGSRGDLAGSGSVLWSHDRGGAYMPTPLLYGGFFHVVHHDGRIQAYDPADGETVYRARFSERGTFTASPVAAGEHMYFGTEEGKIYVAKAGAAWQELAVNEMGEPVMATPAIVDGVLYVRTLSKLYAIGAPGEKSW